jgi:hypothetical protein
MVQQAQQAQKTGVGFEDKQCSENGGYAEAVA